MIHIYRASAGAGKTHKLTGEYIKLLFNHPYAYKHILAVTFTNKATDEMKQRILQELYTLASAAKKSDYLPELMTLSGKDEEGIRREAERILISILHDYSSFSISTIDKFFQMVMRAFAREMGKIATYNVELDRDGVLLSAVDRMFADLDKPENDSLLKWLISYSLDAVDAGNSWDVRKDIISLAKELFSEDFKLKRREAERSEVLGEGQESISGREEIAVLKGKIRSITEGFEEKLRVLGREGVTCMAQCGVGYADFKGGSRSPFKYFGSLAQMPAGTKVEPPKEGFIALYDQKEGWYTGKSIPPGIAAAYDGGLNECIGKIVGLFEREYRIYATAKMIDVNMNALGILDDIYRRVLAYCKEKNVMLLSESTELLNRIIDGSDTPFVYEKIGTRIDHFMLDEFQDTSVLQWRNFYPLLQNSLADGNENLIVGDVKQSIYRWRGSDWNILNSGLFSDFREDEVTSCSLDCNWRSGKHIVDFNNSFFGYCARKAQQVYDGKSVGKDGAGVIEGIYSGFEQTVPKKGEENPGYLEVNFVEPGEDGFEADVLEQLPIRVQELIRSGATQRDVAVLVRTNNQGRQVACALIEAGLDVISNDSLFVCSSFAVQKVVNVLRCIENPDNPSLRIYQHFSAAGGTLQPEAEREFLQRIAAMALYEMCEEIIRTCLSGEEKEDLAFLQSFLDLVLEYTNREGTNLAQFLKWWDESGQQKTISAPQEQDAVSIMTIHKSKGLGFKIVVIPFLKDEFDRSKGRLWCNLPRAEEGGATELVFNAPIPVGYTTALSETVFNADYDREKLCKFVDSLNTAYVAFTRPKEQLIIYSPVPKPDKKGGYPVASVADVLYQYYENVPQTSVVERVGENIRRIATGDATVIRGDSKSASRELMTGVFSAVSDGARLKTSLRTGSVNEETSIREYGIAMHAVFSLIDTVADVPTASHRAFSEGVCNCSAQELAEMVTQKLSSVEKYGWFDPQNRVLNECDIIKPDGNVVRPDRIVIRPDGSAIIVDYKFGERDEEGGMERRYVNQVRSYKRLLQEIGYESCEGYLWYVEEGAVVNC